MRQFSADLQNHLDGEATTLCNCWLILRKDGLELGFTDHDQPIEFDGFAFLPSSGFESSEMENSIGLTPDNHEIIGALISDAISEEDITARRYDGARIRHYTVNWSTPSENTLMQTYLFGEIIREDAVFKAELKSLIATLDQTNLRRFEKQCSADLGDKHCGVDVENGLTVNATISKVLTPDTFEVTGVEAFDTGWFTGGRASFRTGSNANSALEIASHTKYPNLGGKVSVSLWTAPPKPLQIGDQLKLRPGCNKQFSTCRDKFNNALNFRGFPHMPGSEFAASYASNSDNMDGGPLIP